MALSMTKQSKAFDSTVTSDSNDVWLAATNPAATFSPIYIGPGQTGTINVNAGWCFWHRGPRDGRR